jgi:hypothetical protein
MQSASPYGDKQCKYQNAKLSWKNNKITYVCNTEYLSDSGYLWRDKIESRPIWKPEDDIEME